MSSLLFDVPGPKARSRNRVLSVLTVLVVLAIVAFILLRFAQTGQFTAAKWRIFTFPLVQQTIVTSIGATLGAFATAAAGSLVFGILLAFGRLSDRSWISRPCYGITELLRAIPVLIMMMILYYGLPPLGVHGITPFTAVVVGLAAYNGSVLAEVFRAGIESLPQGQKEAGYAIGMSKGQVQRIILLPQAVRSMLPVIIAQLVVILKDTALGFIITYNEILFQANYFGTQSQYGSPVLPALMVAGVTYIVLCLLLSGFAKWLELRLRRGPKAIKAAPPRIMADA
ncbi:amino acid ABC transporter permease [Paenarthrobacter sp. Z7-10]|uniref:amino acid ABC transporter permease n=1 Tax=Paenarthrobacter sp. Z7-10 TaxID=2787635 RepID=UPI0022A9E672|nr:amino acid ABC transporter permease [Paenarthrobacter sp. Z7-10]MCZ2403998.1 amino acid ABC transporter permease [Paenarthrobacter sp. Z7-10]